MNVLSKTLFLSVQVWTGTSVMKTFTVGQGLSFVGLNAWNYQEDKKEIMEYGV